jgi:SAM-dependent methyltransferase
MSTMDVRDYNRQVWDDNVEKGNQWTIPVSSEAVAAARRGDWEIVLTPTIPVPKAWFGELQQADVLCLASGGGQQGPILAAAGANVTVYDYSPRQLAQDRQVAERDGLSLATVAGDMADLSIFPDASFDLIFHPVSNVFVPDVKPVWREAFRVLRPGGALLSGFTNPVLYLFDMDLAEEGLYQVKYALPYSDLSSPDEATRRRFRDQGMALEFGHTLQDQIGGQIQAGFLIAGFYEDIHPEERLSQFTSLFIATRAIKPEPAFP